MSTREEATLRAAAQGRGGQRTASAWAEARSTLFDRWLAAQVLRAAGNPPVGLILWDGRRVRSDEEPSVWVELRDRSLLPRLLVDPSLTFGDGYAEGRIRVRGDLLAFLEAVFHPARGPSLLGTTQQAVLRLLHHPRSNSLRGSRENIHHHYDLGNEFYRMWLDREMVYTCAYYPDPSDTLEEAQQAKMHHVCRKLRLRPGETVAEAGCGWGALALFMARHYGVTVRAYNISHEQVAFARERARAEGLDGQVTFVEDDYRNLSGRYDAFVSVGMLEHVGKRHYRELGRVIRRCLKPEGRGLVHTIGRDRPLPMDRWIERRIFPGAYPPTLKEMMTLFEPYGFSVLDVENLRLHYARTLEHWLERYEACAERVRRLFDERFVRMWRLYLAGSIAAFRSGSLQLFQVVFSRSGENSIPWTRAHLYES
ncbi:MAG: cyclopropane-fatty-acyl-phospholipid synthase family protein [Deferrisomatales bacterium]